MKCLYEFPAEQQKRFIEGHLDCGRIVSMSQGSYGDIFLLERSGQRIAAKCPKISRFGNEADARIALEKAIMEIENTAKYQRYPGVHGFAPPRLVLGWPFFLSTMRDGTLSKMIVEPKSWNLLQRLATLIQIAHTLNYCRSLGLVAHQDLKPDNVFIGKIPLYTQSKADPSQVIEIDPERVAGFTTVAYVADFGIADAFRHIGKNSGSPPYMAPEQYKKTLIADGSKIDVFALGVIAFECCTDGLHPVGERTSEVWPTPAQGKPSKWRHEDVWKRWARGTKDLAPLENNADVPRSFKNMVRRCLAADQADRPDMAEVENELWMSLRQVSPEWSVGVRMQIEYFDSIAPPTEPRAHSRMDECILELRRYYSQT